MRFVIQKVKSASVSVNGEVVGEIAEGFVVLIGITHDDTEAIADYMVNKLTGLRIFEDENQKLNLSIKDTQGSILLVSQFTLYADCSKGSRPSFLSAAKSEKAKILFDYIVRKLKEKEVLVETGVFGAYMQVELINDGPVTIILEK